MLACLTGQVCVSVCLDIWICLCPVHHVSAMLVCCQSLQTVVSCTRWMLTDANRYTHQGAVISSPATLWGPAVVMVCVVRLSVCLLNANIFETKWDRHAQETWIGKRGFLIQSLPLDSRLEVRFRHFGCFRVGTSPIQTEMGRLG